MQQNYDSGTILARNWLTEYPGYRLHILVYFVFQLVSRGSAKFFFFIIKKILLFIMTFQKLGNFFVPVLSFSILQKGLYVFLMEILIIIFKRLY